MNTHNVHRFSDEHHFEIFLSKGDRQSLGELFNRYVHLVYGLCLKYLKGREEAQDAVMEIFEKIGSRKGMEPVQYFKSWLYIVSKNHCLMLLRKKHPEKEEFRERHMENDVSMHLNDETPLNFRLENLDGCMDQLKAEQQECVRMFYIEGKSYQEICDGSNYTNKQVKSHIQNGRRNLKICLEENERKR